MMQDLIDGGALIGRTRSDLEQLLGPPDYREKFWYGYRVITIPRCRFPEVSAWRRLRCYPRLRGIHSTRRLNVPHQR